MTTTKSRPGVFQITIHVVLTLLTAGGWLFVLFYWHVHPNIFMLALHLFATMVTGGLWFFVVLFWYLTKK